MSYDATFTNISGAGTQADPYIISDMAGFKELFQEKAGTLQAISNTWIKFADGGGTLDFSKDGWYGTTARNFLMRIPHLTSASSTVFYTYIDGNGWTLINGSFCNLISGGSVGMICLSKISSDTWSNWYVKLSNLTFKNMYFYNGNSSTCYIYLNSAESSSFANTFIFDRCKFSLCLDATGSGKICWNKQDYGTLLYNNCSINLKVVRNPSASNIYWVSNYTSNRYINNLIQLKGTFPGSDTITLANAYFNKIVGDLDFDTAVLSFRQLSCNGYNVIDMPSSSPSIKFATNLISRSGTISDSQNSYIVTEAQMKNKDYLNSIGFICGDPPTD